MKSVRNRVIAVAVATAIGMLAACAGFLVATAVGMHADGVTGAPIWQVVVCGSPAAVLLTAIVAGVAAALSHHVFGLRADRRSLDVLQLRVRMADELAERHRRLAETAGAGMFELLSGLVAAEEGARGQLAAELHDTVAQSLSGAAMLLDSGDPANLFRAGELVVEAEEQVRAVMARTRPPALRDGDLARAVAALRDDMKHRYAFEVTLSWPSVAYPLPLVTAVTVYRFFQEGLLNAAKHADVDRASAALRVDDDWVVAEVSDEGLGFDADADHAVGGRHVGLGLLRERARLVGGSLDVASARGRGTGSHGAHGTTLTLRLPRGAGLSPVPGPRPAMALRQRVG